MTAPARKTLDRCPDCRGQILVARGAGGRPVVLDCAAKVHHVQREEEGYCTVRADRVMVEHRFVCAAERRRRATAPGAGYQPVANGAPRTPPQGGSGLVPAARPTAAAPAASPTKRSPDALERLRAARRTPDARARQGELMRKRWQDPAFRERLAEGKRRAKAAREAATAAREARP